MRILVTGREGQLARSLIERASEFPALDLRLAGRPEFDLERPEALAREIGASRPDVVLNAAAYTAVDLAEDEPEKAQLVNAEAPAALAAAARRCGARFVQISTDYVFDGRSEGPLTEDMPTNPLGVYGMTKLAGEEMARREHEETVIVRTAWVYSPFGRNFAATMVRVAGERTEVSVVDDQRGNPSSALDLASGLLTMMKAWAAGGDAGVGGTYHLAGSGSASWREFAEAIFEKMERLGERRPSLKAIRTEDWPTKAVRPRNSVLSSERFAATFGYRMPDWRISADAVVERLVGARA
jgi:dTDP-4-dehydrorhamnose reductase